MLCAELFKSDDVWRDFAKSLVNICILNSFDGWLLNIENPVENTKPLINFISYLTKELRKINHEFVILWYDSVVQDGKLKWQNELNDLNKWVLLFLFLLLQFHKGFYKKTSMTSKIVICSK